MMDTHDIKYLALAFLIIVLIGSIYKRIVVNKTKIKEYAKYSELSKNDKTYYFNLLKSEWLSKSYYNEPFQDWFDRDSEVLK